MDKNRQCATTYLFILICQELRNGMMYVLNLIIMTDKKYALIVETEPGCHQLYFSFYLPGSYIELHEIKNHKVMMKKTVYPQIQVQDLYLGNSLEIHGQIYRILAYSDEYTKKELSGNQDLNRTFALLKPIHRPTSYSPKALLEMAVVLGQIEHKFIMKDMKTVVFSPQLAEEMAKIEGSKSEKKVSYSSKAPQEVLSSKQIVEEKVRYLSSGMSVGMELQAPHANTKWKKMMGNQNPKIARSTNPSSLRAVYGVDIIQNCCHGSTLVQHIQKELTIFHSLKLSLHLGNTTLCIVKPHVLREKKMANVLKRIAEEGFYAWNMLMRQLPPQKVMEYMEAYKFLPDFREVVVELQSAPCLLVEVGVETNKHSAVDRFKQLCGPYDPEFAKKIQPGSLRAIFGRSRPQNGVQCTDLPQDSESELKFMFE